MSKEKQQESIESLIDDTSHEIPESEAASSLIATTNATGWVTDECSVIEYKLFESSCVVQVDFVLSGDAEEDDMGMSGTRISGTATATIDVNKRVTYDEVSGEVERD